MSLSLSQERSLLNPPVADYLVRPEEVSNPTASPVAGSLTDEMRSREATLRAGATDDDPLGAFAAELFRLIIENLERMAPPQLRAILPFLRQITLKGYDYREIGFWQTMAQVIAYQFETHMDFIERRLKGEYRTDPYGMDPDIVELVRPLLRFLYRTWWRISTEGLEHVPMEGRALLVSNHSGVLPWDGAMIATAMLEEHPSHRLVRNLYLNWFSTAPFLAPIFTSLGQVAGLPENAHRLLGEEELVCTFPEGLRGMSKPFSERYRLTRFGRGGFVQVALRSGAPLIPVAVVGAEETYPLIGNAEIVARLLGMPFFPMTPFFPWLGPLGLIPLPTKWSITFCPPIPTDRYGPAAADDPLIVFMLMEQVRSTVQETINEKLSKRTSLFW